MTNPELDAAPVAHGEAALLSIRGVDKRFGSVHVLREVDLELLAGCVNTLVGPNGAGKTTLFNAITGHLGIDAGSIDWLGRSILGMPHWKIARQGIARTFQDLRLFDQLSVAENVLTVLEPGSWLWQRGGGARRRERRERVMQILESTGLAAKPDVRAVSLAYAERKFLSLARILATDARLWLLDEPASGLDRQSYDRFFSLLRDAVRRGITVCIIEHNLDIVVEISDRIAFLDQGKLLAHGDPKTILADPSLAAIYFGDRS